MNRDRARPLNAPAPTDPAIEAHLSALVSPATFGLTNYYHRIPKRWRILNLPVMVALIFTMVWRQVPSVSALIRMVSRQPLLWAPPLKVSQQAFTQRLSSLPAALFAEVFTTLLPTLLARSAARARPQPVVVTQSLAHFPHLWIIDATTLEELARKVGLLRESTDKVLAGKLLAVLDLPSKLPLRLWLEPDEDINEKAFLDRVKAVLTAGTLAVFDKGFYALPFSDWSSEKGVSFITRARSLAAFGVQEELLRNRATPSAR